MLRPAVGDICVLLWVVTFLKVQVIRNPDVVPEFLVLLVSGLAVAVGCFDGGVDPDPDWLARVFPEACSKEQLLAALLGQRSEFRPPPDS